MRSDMYSHATPQMDHADETVKLAVYKHRVILAHLRCIFDTGPAPDHRPNGLFALIRPPDAVSRRAQRLARLGDRRHPFVNFRPEETGDEAEDVDEHCVRPWKENGNDEL